MKEITIYTTLTCPFCYKAKRLLSKLGVSYNEISVDLKPKLREEMAAKAGKTSVTQICKLFWDKRLRCFVGSIVVVVIHARLQ